MEGYQRFFIIGLVLVGLVGIYAEHLEDSISGTSDDQQQNDNKNFGGESQETLLTIENDAQPAFDTSKILEKRSNPSGSGGGMSKEDLDWHFEEGRKILAAESEATTRLKMMQRRANQRAQQSQQKPQQAKPQTKPTQTKSTQTNFDRRH